MSSTISGQSYPRQKQTQNVHSTLDLTLVFIDDALCTFETNECGWSEDANDEADWQRKKGATPLPNTGPDADPHSPQGEYIKANLPTQLIAIYSIRVLSVAGSRGYKRRR